MKLLILTPHQDDEILSSCLYLLNLRKYIKECNIAFATNGDYKGKQIAVSRYQESLAALKMCGLKEKNIYYMGYADTGMQVYHSFLYNLYFSDSNKINKSNFSNKTYHPANKKTVHYLFNGKEAYYNRYNFINDLKSLISYLNPNHLIVPSIYDAHGDHMGLSLFTKEVLLNYKKIKVLTYLIHGEDDDNWPPRNTLNWSKPNILPNSVWHKRIIISSDIKNIKTKKKILLNFKSQLLNDKNNFLMSFCKKEELFFNV